MNSKILKRVLLVIMIAAMAVAMTACGGKKTTSNQTAVSSESSSSEKKGSESSVQEEKKAGPTDGHDWPFMAEQNGLRYVAEVYTKCEDLCGWGNYAKFVMGDLCLYIKYPTLIPAGKNNVAYQTDDTVVLVSSIRPKASFIDEIEGLDTIIPVAVKHTDEITAPVFYMNNYWGLHLDNNCSFTIDTTTLETVGQYDCCKHTGAVTYSKDNETEQHTLPFVAYATFSKIGNYPIYWFVFDESEGSTLGDTIADYAKKMGYTIVEDSTK